jgi:hypothetical protein
MWSGDAYATRWESLGESTGDGTTISANNGSKGSYATIGTTGFDWRGFALDLMMANSVPVRVDIAVGASNTIIVPDLLMDARSAGATNFSLNAYIPLGIPSGTAVKARAQAAAGSITLRALVNGYNGDGYAPRPAGRIVNLNGWSGVEPANTVTQSGTAGTRTAWVELTSSAPADLAGLYLAGSTAGDTTRTGGRLIVEIGLGAGGSEVTQPIKWLFPNGVSGGMGVFGIPRAIRIPAGTRIAWRVTGSTTMADTYGIAGWGLVA